MIIHQLLHGYDEGHRLLAGSVNPESQSAKSIMALSDLGGHGDTPPKSGYVTGYPISAMRMYAFAQTWPAPEMPRPGCVWTHTLLIDFSDLASISDLALLSLFNRPVFPIDSSLYSKPIQHESSCLNSHSNFVQEHVLTVMAAIYKFPRESIFVNTPEGFPAIEVAMSVWLQQWPKLRRNFRFCTWAPYDCSRDNDKFDLQFVPLQRHSAINRNRNNPGIRVDLQKPEHIVEQWALTVENNNLLDSSNDLRTFLWRYGAESDEGRSTFIPLVMAWSALKSKNIDLYILSDLFKPLLSISSLSNILILEVARFLAEEPSPPIGVIDFIVNNITILDEQICDNDIDVIAKAIWLNASNKIWEFFRSTSIIKVKVATSAAKMMQPNEVLDGTARDPELFGNIIKANERLAASPLIWDAPAPIPQIAAGFISRGQETAEWVLPALFQSNNPVAANIAVDLFGQFAIGIAVEKYSKNKEGEKKKAESWLFAARHCPESLSHVMIKGAIHDISILEFISTFLSYHTKPFVPKVDEWARALDSSHVLSQRLSFSLSAFLMARALSGISPESSVLIVHAFDSLHTDLLKSNMDYKAWGMLEPLLPEVSTWDRWDKGYILRLGVVKAFVSRQLPPNDFMNITQDIKVYKTLVKTAATFHEGRRYLSDLTLWANASQDEHFWHLGKISGKVIQKSKNQ